MTLYRPPQMPAQSTKEAEAAGSFRIFEAIQALRDGKLPTNDQLVRIIDQVSESQTLSRKKADMSEDGSRFVDDLIDFLAAFKRVVEDKNDDEDIQEVRLIGCLFDLLLIAFIHRQFIFHTRLAATSPLAAEKAKVTADVAKDTEMDPTEGEPTRIPPSFCLLMDTINQPSTNPCSLPA